MYRKIVGITLGISLTSMTSYATDTCFTPSIDYSLEMSIPSIIYTPLVGDPVDLWADFSFYGSAPDGRMLWALNNYDVNSTDVNTAQYQDTIVLTVETGTQINIDAISSIVPYPVTVEGDIATWDQPFWDSFKERDTGQYGSNRIAQGDLIISFEVNKNGIIKAQTKSPDKEDHLFVFLHGHRDDATHSGGLYDLTNQLYWKLKDNGSLSGNIFVGNTEFSNATMSQKNYFSEDITFIYSTLANYQMDYSWITQQEIEGGTAANAQWSPIANNPDQNINLSRSFDIQNNGATSSAFYLLAWADNGMNSQTKVEGFVNIPDYYYAYHSDVLECNSIEGWCRAWNQDCCAISMINKGSVPTKVSMTAYSTWSTIIPAVSIAVFGDITTTNHTESPSPGDDGNPAPLRYVLPSER